MQSSIVHFLPDFVSDGGPVDDSIIPEGICVYGWDQTMSKLSKLIWGKGFECTSTFISKEWGLKGDSFPIR